MQEIQANGIKYMLGANYMKNKRKIYAIVRCVLLLMLIVNVVFAQDNLQRYYMSPPYKGQISGYSDWTISPEAWNELTNFLVDEQGKLVMRPGFYCWKGSVDTTKEILGAYEYTKQIEGGANTYFIFNTNQKIYRTDKYYSTANTDISGGLSFSDDGVPQFDIFYNMLFMANGENTPIMYDQDSNIIEIGRSTYTGAVTFEDTNEVVTTNATYFDTGDYHFRGGMDLTISDSNNDGTYEIVSVDSNVIIIKNTDGTAVDLSEQSDASLSLVGLGTPDNLSSSRTETVIASEETYVSFNTTEDTIITTFQWEQAGFRAGMTLTVLGSTSNDGSYTIDELNYDGYPTRISVLENLTNESKVGDPEDPVNITFTGTNSIGTNNAFCPSCLVGHKGRLFAGGVKEFPTYLYWSRSKYATSYFYDLWRDRYGEDDGVGYYDMQEKVVALEPNFNGMLVIFCDNSIWFLKGDDPGFDILTPNQGFVFQPVPVTKEIGIISANAKKRIGNEIFFYSDAGLQQLSVAAQQGGLATSLISLPVKDLHKTITNDMVLRKTMFEFSPYLNTLFMLFRGSYTSSLDDLMLCYNLNNSSYSTFEFSAASEPVCIFKAEGFEEDPNVSNIIYRAADPAETLWFGSEDGKLFSLHKGFPYDVDYEDTNNATLNSITATAISSKLNMGAPFLEKQFERTVFFCSPQVNYDNTSQGQVSFYRKVDDGSWSSAVTKSFDQHTEADGTAIDYYQFLDAGVGFKGRGKSIQYKIEVSGTTGRFGLEFIGAMAEWLDVDYRI